MRMGSQASVATSSLSRPPRVAEVGLPVAEQADGDHPEPELGGESPAEDPLTHVDDCGLLRAWRVDGRLPRHRGYVGVDAQRDGRLAPREPDDLYAVPPVCVARVQATAQPAHALRILVAGWARVLLCLGLVLVLARPVGDVALAAAHGVLDADALGRPDGVPGEHAHLGRARRALHGAVGSRRWRCVRRGVLHATAERQQQRYRQKETRMEKRGGRWRGSEGGCDGVRACGDGVRAAHGPAHEETGPQCADAASVSWRRTRERRRSEG